MGIDNKLDEEKFEAESRPNTAEETRRESILAPTLSRIRSNNGHGCADLEEGDATDDTLTSGQPQNEKDPFEVAWDGDDDPSCPRSISIVRKWLVVVTVGMGSLCVAVAHNIATMLVARFIDGFAGSSFLSVAGGTVSDVFKRDEIQAPMVIIALSPFIGPSLGPLIGGFINYNTNWRWTYYVMIMWAFALMVMIIVFAPETYHPIKLRDKARNLRKETGDDRWKAPMEKTTKSIAATVGNSLLRPFQLLIFEPMCLLLCLFSAILLGVLYLFFGAFPLVFGNTYGFNLWQTGLSFLGIFVGMICSSLSNPVWSRINRRLLERSNGVPEPEFRLPPAIAGAVITPIGLFIFAWSAYPWVHWIVPIIGSGIFGCGTLLVFTGIFTFLGKLRS
ncbi:3-dehydroquinate dehydratase (3-dehydroquinase) [Hypoxylon texense]